MTVSGNLAPSAGRPSEIDSPYPVLFGMPITPTVTGILLASAGLLGALYLLINFVQPLWQQKQELEQSIATKEAQLANQQSTIKEISKVENALKVAQQREAEVLSLYADEEQLKTLLLDFNQIAGERNSKLTKFEPTSSAPEPLTDASIGGSVNGKLRQQIFKVEMEGNFEATRSTVLTLERLQPLLLIKNLKSEASSPKATLRQVGSQDALLEFDPKTDSVKTSFDLIALLGQPSGSAAQLAPAPGANLSSTTVKESSVKIVTPAATGANSAQPAPSPKQ